MALYFNKVKSIHPRMLCTKFGWNWPIGSREKDFEFCQCIFAIHNYLPLENNVALHLNKNEFPSQTDALCQDWLKLALVLEKEMKIWKVYSQIDRRTIGNQKNKHVSMVKNTKLMQEMVNLFQKINRSWDFC